MREMAQGTIMLDERLRPSLMPWRQGIEDLRENLTKCEHEVLRPPQRQSSSGNSDSSCAKYAKCVAFTALSDTVGHKECPKLKTLRPDRLLVGIGGLPKHGVSDLRATLEVLNKHNRSMVIAGDSISLLMCSWMICELIGSGAKVVDCERTADTFLHSPISECNHGVQCSVRWPDGLLIPAPVFFHFTGSGKAKGATLFDPATFSYDLSKLESGIQRLKTEGVMLIFNGGVRFNGHHEFITGSCIDGSASCGTAASYFLQKREEESSAVRLHQCVMEDWLRWLDDFGSRENNIAIWRETTAQGNPTANGYFEYWDAVSSTFGKPRGKRQTDKAAPPYCVSPGTQSRVFSYQADWRNRIVYEILEKFNSLHVHILPLFRNSLRQIYRSDSDCTHSCVTPLIYKPLWLSLYHIAVSNVS